MKRLCYSLSNNERHDLINALVVFVKVRKRQMTCKFIQIIFLREVKVYSRFQLIMALGGVKIRFFSFF